MAISILGISGSLRGGSYNTALLKHAVATAPADVSVEIADIGEIPLYREEVYQQGFPAAVETFREQIRAADALLIATPEYNFSFSGVLKNAIDWASRPPEHPFAAKPVGIVGAAASPQGSARAQYHLRQVFVFLDGRVINKPEVMVGGAMNAFDDAGTLTDQRAIDGMAAMMQSLVAAVKARA